MIDYDTKRHTYTITFDQNDIGGIVPKASSRECDEIAEALYDWFDEQFYDRIIDLYYCIKED